jgi:hypothetical protein
MVISCRVIDDVDCVSDADSLQRNAPVVLKGVREGLVKGVCEGLVKGRA